MNSDRMMRAEQHQHEDAGGARPAGEDRVADARDRRGGAGRGRMAATALLHWMLVRR